jgi:dTDP-4-amino-4,6-dideoxygalactose transaminase
MENNSRVIPFNKPYITGREMLYISETFSSGHLAGNGRFTRRSENQICEALRADRVLLVHSCTAALEMSALLLNIGPGDEVIMPSFTFVSTANAFVLRGAVPVFVDIREDTLNIDENLIESHITTRTKAIVVVHYAGVPCEMRTIAAIGKKYNVAIIEDAAQAIGTKYDGKYLGTIGEFGALSFHETKNIMSGEGGALIINQQEYFERAEIIREKGTDRSRFSRGVVDKYTWQDVGSSYVASEVVAAMLSAQLDEIDRILATRRRIWEYYSALLSRQSLRQWFVAPSSALLGEHNAHTFYLLMRRRDDRDRLLEFLNARSIGAVFHYVPLHSSPFGRRFGRVLSELNVTDRVASSIVRLPLYCDLSEDDVAYVANMVVECCVNFG